MKALITGGLGFIGSNLAHKLVQEGAEVTIIDALIPGLGWNVFNIEGIKDKVHFIKGDVGDKRAIEKAVKGKDVIFHFAGQTDHMRSIEKPYEDVSMRINGTLSVLDACRSTNPDARIIFGSTRAVYGDLERLSFHQPMAGGRTNLEKRRGDRASASERACRWSLTSGVSEPFDSIPVREDFPTNPKSMYAITSLAVEKILDMYKNLYGNSFTILRLVNTYGPRHQMKRAYGVLNYFIKQAVSNKPITVMGAGDTIRDFLFVDDACEACLECTKSSRINGEILNLGSGIGVSFLELANKIRSATNGTVKRIEYTKKLKQVEPGDFIADISKIKKFTSWKPKTSLDDGIKKTIDFYKKNKRHYWQ